MTLLGWMVQNTLTAGALALIVVVICRVRRCSPAMRSTLWLLVVAKLVAPPLAYWPVAIEWPAPSSTSAGLTPPPETVAVTGRPQAGPRGAVTPSGGDVMPAVGVMPQPAHRSGDEHMVAFSPWFRLTMPPWLNPSSALLLLIAGSVGMAILQGMRLLQLRGLIRAAHAAPAWLATESQAMARRLQVTAPRIGVAGGIGSPLVFGVSRPMLLWPASLCDHQHARRYRGVLAHELAHIRRLDHWVGWLELIASVVCWWNPVFWYARRHMRDSAELACDAWVVSLLPHDRRAYAEALIDVSAQMPRFIATAPAPGLGVDDRQSFERRLRMIMKDNVKCGVSLAGIAVVVLLAAVALPSWSLVGPAGASAAVPYDAAVDEYRPSPRGGAQSVQDDHGGHQHGQGRHAEHRGHDKHAGGHHDDQHEWWRTHVAVQLKLDAAVASIKSTTGAGNIEIVESKSGRLEIDADVSARMDLVDASRYTEVFEDHVTVTREGDVLRIEDAHRHAEGTQEGWVISLTIGVPRALSVDLTSGAGQVAVRRPTRDVKAASGAGDVVVVSPTGSVKATSGAGAVRIEAANAMLGSVEASSGAGLVRLLAAGASGTLKASSGAGFVHVTLTGSSPAGDVALSSGAGNVTLEVPGDIQGEFNVTTSMGTVVVDPALGLAVEPRGAGAMVKGLVGHGGPHFRISTGVGAVHITVQ